MGKSKTDSSSESESESSSDSNGDSTKLKKEMKKLKKKIKKEEKKKEKRLRKKIRNEKRKLKKHKKSKCKDEEVEKVGATPSEENKKDFSNNVPIGLMERSKAMAPMTKEEWEKRQSVVRRVLDEESGRYRLIKGDGEVLEEIVSQKRHQEINKQATKADGEFFQAKTVKK